MSTGNTVQSTRDILMFPYLGINKKGEQIVNQYNVQITDYKLGLSTNPFTNQPEPQLLLEVVNLDSGYRIETVKGKPARIDGDIEVGDKYILRGPTVSREYYEPQEGKERSRLQDFVAAVTGGVSKADADLIFQEGFLLGKRLVVGIEIATSKKGNTYQKVVSYEASEEDLDIPADFDTTSLLQDLVDEGAYAEWDLEKYPLTDLWQKAEIPTAEVVYFSILSDDVRETLLNKGFSLKKLDPKRIDEKGENKSLKWIIYPKTNDAGQFIKTNYDAAGKASDTVIADEQIQEAFDYANALGIVPASEQDLIEFISVTDTSEHYEWLKNWAETNMPDALAKGYIRVSGNSSKPSKIGLKRLKVNSPKDINLEDISVTDIQL
jgi:hypothetical protein